MSFPPSTPEENIEVDVLLIHAETFIPYLNVLMERRKTIVIEDLDPVLLHTKITVKVKGHIHLSSSMSVIQTAALI